MKLILWKEWIEKHIPYYEAEKLKNRFLDNPPKIVLVIYPNDEIRNQKIGPNWLVREQFEEKISSNNPGISMPVFLERDTHQKWFWAFWDEQCALLTIMRL